MKCIVKKIVLFICVISVFTMFSFESFASVVMSAGIPDGAKKLIAAYPDMELTYHDNKIFFPDGTSIVYNDGLDKDYLTKLNICDIEDMYSEKYDKNVVIPTYLSDAGRYRCDELFAKMYGKDKAEVEKNLTTVDIKGWKFRVTTVNGVDKRLGEIADEILHRWEFTKYFKENTSTYNWRNISNTIRVSSHSYGIAIDINYKLANYWQWDHKAATELSEIPYKNSIPMELVEIFERHGFIWGGRWYHYDTMHFEYRPDLLLD